MDRFSRQADLVPWSAKPITGCTVIGVGAIGRQVALQLAAMGAPRIQLIDFDTVDETNVTTQGYAAGDVGRSKVEATKEALARIDPTIPVDTVCDRYRPTTDTLAAIFCCVDRIEARQAIWRSLSAVPFWTDGRMLGETIRVLTVTTTRDRNYYPTTFFSASEAEPGRCTARSTIYAANIAAGLMVHQLARWLRDIDTDPDLLFNLTASELSREG